jgi:hypothetical protein
MSQCRTVGNSTQDLHAHTLDLRSVVLQTPDPLDQAASHSSITPSSHLHQDGRNPDSRWPSMIKMIAFAMMWSNCTACRLPPTKCTTLQVHDTDRRVSNTTLQVHDTDRRVGNTTLQVHDTDRRVSNTDTT